MKAIIKRTLIVMIISASLILALCSCDMLFDIFSGGEHTHAYYMGEEEIIRPATCLVDGEKKFVCYECGEELIDVIPALGYHVDSEWITDVEESDENDGKYHVECINCGEIIDTIVTHRFGDPVEKVAPTLTEPGVAIKSCDRCDHTEEVEISPLLIFTPVGDEYAVSASAAASAYDEIVIPDTYKGLKVTKIEDRAFMDFHNLTKIVIGNNIEYIGKSAFWNCENLTTVNISKSVEFIGSDAFYGCEQLNGVYITDIDAWCNIDFDYYYSGSDYTYHSNPLAICDNLYLNGELVKDVVIPDDVTLIAPYLFSCSSLESVIIGDNVEFISEHAFYSCKNLSSVTLGNSVTEIYESAFENCVLISTLTLPSSLESISNGAFYGCTGLVEIINLSSLDIVAGSTEHGRVAYYAITVSDSESSIDKLDDFTFITNDGVNYLVSYSGKDKILTLPENYNGEAYEIYANTFYGRSDLISVTIPEAVSAIGENAFFGCYGLVEVVNLSDLLISSGSTANGCVAEYAKTITKHSSRLSNIDNYIFLNDYIKTFYVGYIGDGGDLVLPEDFDGDEYVLYEYAFAYRNDITSVVLPSYITEIPAELFKNCSNLQSITIPKSVVSVGENAFEGCGSLANVYIEDLVAWFNISYENLDAYNETHPLYYANNLYLNGEALTNLVIPVSITDIPAYSLSFKITDITVHDYVNSFAPNAFFECRSIKNVYIGNVKNWCSIDFSGEWGAPLEHAENLYIDGVLVKELVIPYGIHTIPGYAFSCENITSVTIPNTVGVIDSCAFRGCYLLKNITIPPSVHTISDSAFLDCDNITEIHISDFDRFSTITVTGGLSYILEHPYDIYLNGEKLTDIVFPEGRIIINTGIFRYSNIESISFPTSVQVIKGFLGSWCQYLTEIHVKDLDLWCQVAFDAPGIISKNYDLYVNGNLVKELVISEGVSVINNFAFAYSGITKLTLPASVSIISDSAFSNCANLEEVVLTNGIMHIGEYAFSNCDALVTVSVSDKPVTEQDFNEDKYGQPSVRENAFSSCDSLKKVTLPERIEVIYALAFSETPNLVEVNLPDGIVYIEADAFITDNDRLFTEYKGGKYLGNEENPYLVLVKVDDNQIFSFSVHKDTKVIADRVFQGFESLKSVDLPDGLKIIGRSAFYYCLSLKDITIPDSVILIGEEAFYRCDSLDSANIPSV